MRSVLVIDDFLSLCSRQLYSFLRSHSAERFTFHMSVKRFHACVVKAIPSSGVARTGSEFSHRFHVRHTCVGSTSIAVDDTI